MKLLKLVIVILAVIGTISLIQHSFSLMTQEKPQAILSENADTKSNKKDGSLQEINDRVAIPTLDQSVQLPQAEFVECSKKIDDRTYQFNFGLLPKEICLEKIKKLQDGWEKEFDKLLKNQTEENYNSSLIVPNDLEFDK